MGRCSFMQTNFSPFLNISLITIYRALIYLNAFILGGGDLKKFHVMNIKTLFRIKVNFLPFGMYVIKS